MHNLGTGLITATYPTQIFAASFGAHNDDGTPSSLSAFVTVEIDGQNRVCEVRPTSTIDTRTDYGKKLFEEWSEMIDNNERVTRTVTLIAEPSDDVIGTAHIKITQIDLRVEAGENRFFATVIR